MGKWGSSPQRLKKKTKFRSVGFALSTSDILPGIGLRLTIDINQDIDNKRLTNVADPEDHEDAVNKEYIDQQLT